MERQEQPQDSRQARDPAAEEDERDRRATNIFLAVAAVLLLLSFLPAVLRGDWRRRVGLDEPAD